jgi:hypothetical protein
MPDNPKILSVSLGARWALIKLWCYCAGSETDGHVPDEAARQRASKKLLDELAGATLIHRNGSGWIVNDWLEYNISAADAKKKREQDAERLRRWRASRNGNAV